MPEEGNPRRELFTKLLPFIAASAIKIGMLTSPLGIISSAAGRYNETVQQPSEKITDLLPLLPGVENLKVQVLGPDTVTMALQRKDLRSCAEVYLEKFFISEGSGGARSGTPMPTGPEAQFDYVLRLPSRNVFLKLAEELSDEDASKLLDVARKLNPAEVVVIADRGHSVSVQLDPVFASENKVLRGRFRSMSTEELLSAFFGRKFAVRADAHPEAIGVTLTLR